MTEPEEIKEMLERILADSKGLSSSNVVCNILEYLHSQGVKITYKKETEGGYIWLQKSLIKETA